MLPTPKGLVKFGSVPYSNEAQPPVPLELMVPFSTALVLAIEVAARVVTAGGGVVGACASRFLYEIKEGIPTDRKSVVEGERGDIGGGRVIERKMVVAATLQ